MVLVVLVEMYCGYFMRVVVINLCKWLLLMNWLIWLVWYICLNLICYMVVLFVMWNVMVMILLLLVIVFVYVISLIFRVCFGKSWMQILCWSVWGSIRIVLVVYCIFKMVLKKFCFFSLVCLIWIILLFLVVMRIFCVWNKLWCLMVFVLLIVLCW